MFPRFREDVENPSDFWGGAEVPPYREINISQVCNSRLLAEKIRKSGNDCTGYIEKDSVFYHIVNDKKYYSDFYRDFVFIYFKDIPFTGQLPYGYLMLFLQYKSKKTLLIYENECFLIEKTDETFTVCEELDKIYFDFDFFDRNIISRANTVSTDDIVEELYHNLITEYLNKKGMTDYKPADDFDVLIKILKLRVE